MLCQGTAGSLTGKFGARVQQLAHKYLREGCYHFIGSDAHGAVNRKPGLQEACAVIESYNANAAGLLTAVNPERLLRGQAPISLPAMSNKVKPSGKSFWGGFWGKISSRK